MIYRPWVGWIAGNYNVLRMDSHRNEDAHALDATGNNGRAELVHPSLNEQGIQ